MKFKYIIYILLIGGVLALVGYRIYANQEMDSAGGGSTGQVSVSVSGQVMQAEEFSENLALSGSLEANERVELRSEIAGVVEQINFEEGSRVTKGQVLFKVNDLELRAQYAKAKTAEKLAAENERRAGLLLNKEAISQEEYDLAEADLASAKAQSQLVAAQLAKTTIRAPFSGTIGLRYISEGTYVSPSSPLASLVDRDKMKISFSIPEKYASQVKLGDFIRFTTSGSAEELSAEIYAIEPEVSVNTRSLRMRAITDNEEGKLIPGTYANISLPLASVKDALMVPTEALIPIQNGKKIFISEGGKAKEVVVETGARTASSVRVLSGLKAGDTILTSGVMTLKDGVPVNVTIKQPVANLQ